MTWSGEVLLWNPQTQCRSPCLVVASDQAILAQCEGVLIPWLQSSPEVKKNGLAELSPQTHMPRGLNRVRTLVWNQPMPIRVLNGTFQDQTLIKGSLHTVNQSHW